MAFFVLQNPEDVAGPAYLNSKKEAQCVEFVRKVPGLPGHPSNFSLISPDNHCPTFHRSRLEPDGPCHRLLQSMDVLHER